MPPKNRVGRDNRGDLPKTSTAQAVSVHGQPATFLIGQTDSATHMPTKDAVFFDQVGCGLLLPLVEPGDQRDQEHAEKPRVDHGERVYITKRI